MAERFPTRLTADGENECPKMPTREVLVAAAMHHAQRATQCAHDFDTETGLTDDERNDSHRCAIAHAHAAAAQACAVTAEALSNLSYDGVTKAWAEQYGCEYEPARYNSDGTTGAAC